jgi:hypothetical protein
MAMHYYSHVQSKRIYEVLSRSSTEVHYRAVGNGGSQFRLTPAAFDQKLSRLPEGHESVVNRFRIELETYRGDVDMLLLTRLKIATQDDPQVDVSELEWWKGCNAGPGELLRPVHDFTRLALSPGTAAEVNAVVASILFRPEIDADFRMAEICPTRRSVYCFYGPPGTGKTITIHAVAKRLGKLLYQVDYSSVNSAASRKEIFRRAKIYNAILFMDEADSLCAARTFWPSATAQQLNTAKNVFIQAIDRYDGPILMSTNLINHFDEAMTRRISRHICLTLPNVEMRKKLFQLHLPNLPAKIAIDLDLAATVSDGLSGGDIQNVCFNAIDAACVDGTRRQDWKVTTGHILTEIDKVNRAKKDSLSGNLAVRRGRGDGQAMSDEQ